MFKIKNYIVTIVFLLFLSVISVNSFALTISPSATVRRLYSTALNLQAGNLSPKLKVSKIITVLNTTLDIHRISLLLVGRNYLRMNPQQQQVYNKYLRIWLLNKIAKSIINLHIQEFTINKADNLQGGYQTVLTTIIYNKNTFKVIFAGHMIDSQFKIIDINIDGASLLISQRAEFNQIINTQGIATFIQKLKAIAIDDKNS